MNGNVMTMVLWKAPVAWVILEVVTRLLILLYLTANGETSSAIVKCTYAQEIS